MARGRTPCPVCAGQAWGDNDGEGWGYHGSVCGACGGDGVVTRREAEALVEALAAHEREAAAIPPAEPYSGPHPYRTRERYGCSSTRIL